MEDLNLRSKRDLLPGMEVRLLPHQIIGVNWMVRQERESPHKGGILADEMGLGKTVQMIATMALNQPDPDDSHRTTLVVVPAALLLQWKEEFEAKTNGLFSVYIHHGRDKLRTLRALGEHDVIITTYHTLNSDFSIPEDVESGQEMEYLVKNGGVLARMKWYRVILDEAQFVRNRGTRSSKSVAMLRAKYRWCLTGTPITNTLADIYGFLRFGRFRPWNDWESFNEHIAKVQLNDAPVAGLRAQEILKPLMLRRTKDAELEGEPLLQLPEKHVELVELEFSEEERELYDNFEKRARIQISRLIRSKRILKEHSTILVLILRLRQLCCHPQLILSLAEEFEDPTTIVGSELEKEVARANKLLGPAWVMEGVYIRTYDLQLTYMARARANQFDFDDESDEPEPTCPVCGDLFMNDSGRLLACGHEVCADCLEVMSTSPVVHNGEFGNEDERTNERIEKEFEAAATKGLRPCPTCKKMQDLRPSHVFRSSAFHPTSDEVRHAIRKAQDACRRSEPSQMLANARSLRKAPSKPKIANIDIASASSSEEDLPDIKQLLSHSASSPSTSKTKVKQKQKVGEDDSDDDDAEINLTMEEITGKRRAQKASGNDERGDSEQPHQMSDALIAAWRRNDDDMEPSTKMLALISSLQEWDACGDKTIVFSQWTSMLDLIETLFARHGIRSLRYDGKMHREAREAVLIQFRKAGGPKVILISTKCGGVGLNLTSANRIVNMDLAWNYASESQAYDRVHRLGQEKEVHVKRLVVRDTIEQRMLKLQETKTGNADTNQLLGLAETALGEGSGIKLHKLSVKELKDVSGIGIFEWRKLH
ncbi:hypothetical protein WOLCODRAFT_102715 [Wolfiporia cocos MD-104 SS10]|uniref:Nucleoside triphosphate hydrolase protein n=1 Tax=Wolfiporia cocos (strain MD-104) TaxID=742152 RepID=A0A2H3JN04_WOLCO|nr:hypothetical protein WOLCODRAFT_102715 [Wolfiporia cocos MD-104 SS10]